MARIARVVIPGVAHHVIQRGNRRQKTFFRDQDYAEYIRLMKAWCDEAKVEIWAYCLMPNHVHLIAVPKTEEGFRLGIAEAHRRYTRYINFRKKWRGHLWQERFHSYPMDEGHLVEAVRYVELNPVRAGMVKRAHRYPWSSAVAHERGQDDVLVKVRPMLKRVNDWGSYLAEGVKKEMARKLEQHARTGWPLGNERFLNRLEKQTRRILRPKSVGRPKLEK